MSELCFLSATQIAALISRGEVSVREVVDQHIQRLEELQPTINAMTARCFDTAMTTAREADRQRNRKGDGSTLGPLFGVPVTIKDAFAVKGTHASVGLTNVAEADIAIEDAPLVRQLRSAGAIVTAKTNVPQMMFSHECNNPKFGRTHNPWNLERTPGGSSGGEAAIIAAGGSPLGLGGDLGGSIRIPSHFCGIAGLKPTTGRLTRLGSFRNLRGMTTIDFQPGPMARYVDDLDLAMSVLTSDGQGFSDTMPSKHNGFSKIDVSRLRIGIFESHDFLPAADSVRRTVAMAAKGLEVAGAQLVPYNPTRFVEAIGCYLSIMTADGGADMRRLTRGSKLDPALRKTLLLMRIPQLLRKSLAAFLSIAGQQSLAFALRNTGPRSADRSWQFADQRHHITQATLAQWDKQELDAVIMPVHALPALHHGTASDLVLPACYSCWTNLLEMPAGSVPVSTVQPSDISTPQPRSRDLIRKMANKAEVESVGLPLGIQVVARHWREDIVLAVMKAVEEAMNFHHEANWPNSLAIDSIS